MKYRDFAKRMRALASPEVKDAFYNGCVNELAGRVLSKVKKKTPVGEGVYAVDPVTGKRQRIAAGGTLRPGMECRAASEGRGGTYEAKVLNNVKYASYVEYGHRQHVGQFVPVLRETPQKTVDSRTTHAAEGS